MMTDDGDDEAGPLITSKQAHALVAQIREELAGQATCEAGGY